MYRGCPLDVYLEQHIMPRVQLISDHLARLTIPISMDIGILNQFIVLDKPRELLLTHEVIGVALAFTGARCARSD